MSIVGKERIKFKEVLELVRTYLHRPTGLGPEAYFLGRLTGELG